MEIDYDAVSKDHHGTRVGNRIFLQYVRVQSQPGHPTQWLVAYQVFATGKNKITTSHFWGKHCEDNGVFGWPEHAEHSACRGELGTAAYEVNQDGVRFTMLYNQSCPKGDLTKVMRAIARRLKGEWRDARQDDRLRDEDTVSPGGQEVGRGDPQEPQDGAALPLTQHQGSEPAAVDPVPSEPGSSEGGTVREPAVPS